MIKKIFSVAVAALAFAVVANADDKLTFNWAHSVDGATSGGDNLVGMVKSADDHYYVATTFGTTNSSLTVNFDGETLTDADGNAIQGSPYSGTSYNNNLLLQKIDPATGSVLWYVYTDRGGVDQGYTDIAAASDGGVVVSVKTRAWVEEAGVDNLLEVIDATGSTTTVKDVLTQKGEYRQVLMKISSEGSLEWARVISGLCVPKGGKIKETDSITVTQATKDNFYAYGLALGANDTIFICGNFRTELDFMKADGSTMTLTAQNNKGWDGDSQDVIGDLFLAKLDNEGYYVSSLTAEGTAACAFFDNVVYADGTLYLNGRVKADTTTMTVGNKEVAASSSFQTMILASVNASDLSVNHLNTLTSVGNSKSKFALQNKSAQLIDGYMYYTGSINGSWSKSEGSELLLENSKSTQYKGYILKVDNATGEVENTYVRTDGSIGGYFGVYVVQNHTYAFGYDMGSGAILTTLKNDFKTVGATDVICKYGTVAICATPIVDGENFVMANRGKNSATFYGTDKTFSTTNWGCVYYSYKIDDTATGIATIATQERGSYTVYTLDGVRLKDATTYDEAVSGLQKGVYIVGGKKVVVK